MKQTHFDLLNPGFASVVSTSLPAVFAPKSSASDEHYRRKKFLSWWLGDQPTLIKSATVLIAQSFASLHELQERSYSHEEERNYLRGSGC